MARNKRQMGNQLISCSTQALNISQEKITYNLFRSKRRTVGLVINSEGLRVCAPYQFPQEKINSLLEQKSSWIIKKLKLWQSQHSNLDNQINWREHTYFSCCNVLINTFINYSSSTSVFDFEKRCFTIGLAGRQLQALSTFNIEPYFKAIAKEYLGKKLQEKASHAGLCYRRFDLSRASTCWGSCTSKTDIRLNWRLIFLPDSLVDYVIAHELAHLIEMNHSAHFWMQVKQLMPSYLTSKKILSTIKMGNLPKLINS